MQPISKHEIKPQPNKKKDACTEKPWTKLKHEREARLKKKQMEEEQKSIYEKEIAAQLTETYFTIRDETPSIPSGESRKVMRGKIYFGIDLKVT